MQIYKCSVQWHSKDHFPTPQTRANLCALVSLPLIPHFVHKFYMYLIHVEWNLWTEDTLGEDSGAKGQLIIVCYRVVFLISEVD